MIGLPSSNVFIVMLWHYRQALSEEMGQNVGALTTGLRAFPSTSPERPAYRCEQFKSTVVQPLRPTVAMRSLALASIASVFGPGAVWRVVRALTKLGRATFLQLYLAVRFQNVSRLAHLPPITQELVCNDTRAIAALRPLVVSLECRVLAAPFSLLTLR